MYRRILVAIDDSPTSTQALRTALQVARLRGGSVRIVNVLEHPAALGGYPYGAYGKHFLERARTRAADLLAEARHDANGADIDAETHLLDGDGRRLGETVADEAQAWQADLVVVGSHGRRGISRAVLGSGAEEVLRLASVPVLVVHEGRAARTTSQENPMFKRILVPVDGSGTSTKALVAALQLARESGGRVPRGHSLDELVFMSDDRYGSDLLGVACEQAHKVLEAAMDVAKAAGVPVDARLLESPGQRLGDAVAEEASAWDADLIVLGTHGRRGLGRVVLGSGAEQVIRCAPVPVLAIRGGAGAAAR